MHELMPKVRFELTTTIDGDGGWEPTWSNPMCDEGVGDRDGCIIWQRNGFRPVCEAVYACKEIGKSFTRQQGTHEIDMGVIEADVGNCEVTKRSDRVTMYLSFLAL